MVLVADSTMCLLLVIQLEVDALTDIHWGTYGFSGYMNMVDLWRCGVQALLGVELLLRRIWYLFTTFMPLEAQYVGHSGE